MNTIPPAVTPAGDDSDSTDNMLVFGYGSNGTNQLRGRLKNPNLRCRRAMALDHCRAFCMRSPGWAGRTEELSGIATLVPQIGETTHGSVAMLTREEVAMLDVFEGVDDEAVGYNKVEIAVHLYDEAGNAFPKKAIAYVAKSGYWVVTPSEHYLTAIHVHLREHWNTVMEGDEPIVLRGFDRDGDMFTGKVWLHPGVVALSLEALCVEINALKTEESCWEMPKAIGQVVQKLCAIGIKTTAALQKRLQSDGGGDALNDALESAGNTPFGKETMEILERLLLGGSCEKQKLSN